MPLDPPRDQQGKIIPHDHADILDGYHLIRHTTPNDLAFDQSLGAKRLSSGAFSESSDGGMSVYVEEWMVADGLGPLNYLSDSTHGAVRLNVGQLRALGFKVGWDPDNGPRHHAAVWGIGNGSKRKKKIWAIKETIKKALGEF